MVITKYLTFLNYQVDLFHYHNAMIAVVETEEGGGIEPHCVSAQLTAYKAVVPRPTGCAFLQVQALVMLKHTKQASLVQAW